MAGISRAQIRNTVARMLNDHAHATANDAGQTNSLTDVLNLSRETGYFQGMEVYFSDPGSPHYGHLATVTRSDGPTRTIFFEPPLPDGVIEGETIDLYNFKSRGTRWSEYNEAINDALTIAIEQHALEFAAVAGASSFSANPGTLSIPDELVSFSGVAFLMSDGRTINANRNQYEVNRFTWELDFKRSFAPRWNGRMPTFYGYRMAELLNDDDDTTTVEAEWLFNEVKAQLLERMVASGMPIGSQDRLYLQERTEAGGKRPMIITRAMPNTVRRL